MKLEIKHIAPYLPYGLRIDYIGDYATLKGVDSNGTMCIDEDNEGCHFVNIDNIKPILRPLSDLFNGNYEHILDEFSISSLDMFETAFLLEIRSINAFDFVNYTTVLLLLENHFDIYGLIEKGLAIGINTLQK